jgi:hypothetical protein
MTTANDRSNSSTDFGQRRPGHVVVHTQFAFLIERGDVAQLHFAHSPEEVGEQHKDKRDVSDEDEAISLEGSIGL